MKILYIILSMILSEVLYFSSVTSVSAIVPSLDFPSCTDFAGQIKVSYSSGEHAIVGEQGLKSGSDKVFTLNNNNYLQCFCPPSGSGVQTDWLAAGGLTQSEINDLVTRGWHFIENGASWGLNPGPYMARNSSFSCNGTTTTTTSSSSSSGNGGGGGGR